MRVLFFSRSETPLASERMHHQLWRTRDVHAHAHVHVRMYGYGTTPTTWSQPCHRWSTLMLVLPAGDVARFALLLHGLVGTILWSPSASLYRWSRPCCSTPTAASIASAGIGSCCVKLPRKTARFSIVGCLLFVNVIP